MKCIQQLLLALRLQHSLQFGIAIEMIFNSPLGTACNKYKRLGARRQRFVDRVLNQRLVDDGQHLFRAGLGDGKKARAASGNGENGGLDGFGVHGEIIADFNRV